MKTFIKVVSLFLIVGLMASMFVGCTTESEPSGNEGASNGGEKKDGEIVIGLSMDTLKEERWQRDRDIFVAKAEEMGAKVLVQAANGNDNKQVEQAENLLAQGVDVLVVVPHNGEISATIVESAHAEGVPVLSYDRLIKNSEVDYYISFDNEKVGRLQAEYILSKVNKGNFVYIGGAPTDNNALLFRKGAIDVLQPYVDKGDIKIVYDQFSKEWQPSEAQKHMENALTANNDNVDAVICANDGTGGGAIAALAEQQLAGKIPVTGQDAELAATQRIVEGLQSMTVYKPIEKIATKAAEVAIKIAKKEEVEVNNKVNNGKIDVPSILLEPIKVDKDNMMDTIVKDGFHKFEDVYRNVPEDQRPQQ